MFFQLFPNPADNLLFITSEGAGSSAVQLFDMLGNRLTVPLRVLSEGKLEADISGLPPGLFLVQLETNGLKAVQLVIKK